MSAAADQTKQVTMRDLKPQPEQPVQNLPVVRSGFDTLQAFELMQRGAKLLASSTLVPKEYQGNLPNCVIALNMSQRIGADPLLVMQNLYVVHGRPGWSAQFLIACFNQCGRFASIRYRKLGTKGKDDWGLQAFSKELATGDIIEGPEITIEIAKKEGWYQKSGSKWQTIPELMLMYRAAAWMIRTHAPEISMGLQTTEELGDVYDAKRGSNGQFAVTLETLREGVEAEIPSGTVEVVDTNTGEVLAAKKTPLPEGFDTAKAEADLRACKDMKKLLTVWTEIRKVLGDAGVPLAVDAAYTEMQESFGKE